MGKLQSKDSIAMSWGSSEVEQILRLDQGDGSNPVPQHHIICGHQPVYLPGIIVMNKIALADACMFVGHCDYQPRSWHARNYIRGPSGEPLMLSVPVRKGVSINETQLASDNRWRRKHLNAIENRYSSYDYFDEYYPEIRATILTPHASLADLNIALIHILMHMLDIDTLTYRSEDYNIGLYYGKPTKMLAEMCAKLGARHYLSSPGEKYVKLEQMNGFGHSFQKFTHPVYSQKLHHNFLPNLSVIDLLFSEGPEASRFVKEAGRI